MQRMDLTLLCQTFTVLMKCLHGRTRVEFIRPTALITIGDKEVTISCDALRREQSPRGWVRGAERVFPSPSFDPNHCNSLILTFQLK